MSKWYFESANPAIVLVIDNREVPLTPCRSVAGPVGVFATESEVVAEALQKRGSGIREIDEASYQRRIARAFNGLVFGKKLVHISQPGSASIEPPNESGRGVAIVQLGRMGDIINILPMAKALSAIEGEPITVVAGSDFASVLDGCSYVKPLVWSERWDRPIEAMNALRGKFRRIHLAQIYGAQMSVDMQCDSFAKESWRQAGFLPLWGRFPLVFDRRSQKREAALVRKHVVKDTPTILYNFAGTSSPVPDADKLLADLKFRHGDRINFVDLSKIKADRIYDLLGLYESASGLISGDTATLHLASAVPELSVCGLVTDTRSLWHGSRLPLRLDLELRYREIMPRREEIHRWVDRMPSEFTHVFSEYDVSGESARRHGVARKTWANAYSKDIRPMPVRNEQLTALFSDSNGRALPYVNDLIDFGFLNGATNVVLTNADTCFAPSIQSILKPSPTWFPRRDFNRISAPLTDKQIANGGDYVGTDMFVIPGAWWLEHRSKFPLMILAAEAWDCVLRELMRETGGSEVRDAIYHERHANNWSTRANRYSLASQKWNLSQAKQFFAKRKIDPSKFGIK